MTSKVGIMSMQRISNYGSSLQAFGLRRLIEGARADLVVSFVDFRPGGTLLPAERPRASSSGLRRSIAKVAEYNQVDAQLSDKLRFFNHKRRYARQYFPMLGIPLEPDYDLDLDVQVIGSDEVFNCVQANSNVGYARELFGHNSPAKRLVSYAGSFGNTTYDKIEMAGIGPMLTEDFSNFSSISVRDQNSAQIVERLTGRSPDIHVDPVLAYDFMHLESRIPAERQHEQRYVLVYGYSGRLDHKENVAVVQYARSIDARVLCIGGIQECCDRFVDCNPFEVLAYFRDAEAIITDTFHGTILSMINNKPFGCLSRASVGAGYGNEEKLGHLLATFGLESQRVADISEIADVLGRAADYTGVREVLTRERQRTRTYLDGVLR